MFSFNTFAATFSEDNWLATCMGSYNKHQQVMVYPQQVSGESDWCDSRTASHTQQVKTHDIAPHSKFIYYHSYKRRVGENTLLLFVEVASSMEKESFFCSYRYTSKRMMNVVFLAEPRFF